jgi:hypothetical protein
MGVGPTPGEYGPVSWSVPRPATLWAYLVVTIANTLLVSFYRPLDISMMVGWILEGGILYLLLRGSKLMWWFSLLMDAFAIYASLSAYRADGRISANPDDHVILIHAVLATIALLLLINRSTRDFFDLERRRELQTATEPQKTA